MGYYHYSENDARSLADLPTIAEVVAEEAASVEPLARIAEVREVMKLSGRRLGDSRRALQLCRMDEDRVGAAVAYLRKKFG